MSATAKTAQKRQRTCIGCGTVADKAQLHRIVRAADGSVAFDATGRMPGRGAYVCSAKCLVAALEKRRLQRSLKCDVSAEQRERIIDDAVRALGEVEEVKE